jgi:hypothetical protein
MDDISKELPLPFFTNPSGGSFMGPPKNPALLEHVQAVQPKRKFD